MDFDHYLSCGSILLLELCDHTFVKRKQMAMAYCCLCYSSHSDSGGAVSVRYVLLVRGGCWIWTRIFHENGFTWIDDKAVGITDYLLYVVLYI